MIKTTTYLSLLMGSVAATCVDTQAGCQLNWCAAAEWAAVCELTCGLCSAGDESPAIDESPPASPSPCVDLQTGCQANWCSDSYWNSQCKATCGSCDGELEEAPTVTPTTSTVTPVEPTATPTVQVTKAPTSSSVTPPVVQVTNAPMSSSTPSPPVQVTDAPTPSSTPSPRANDKKFVMYYPAWATYGRNFQVADIDASRLTHINYGFVNIANGECVLGDAYADTQKFFSATDSWNDPEPVLRGNFNQLNHLKAQHPHLVTMISIGGWTWSTDFSSIASTVQGRTKFAQSCSNMMSTYGFDGIDVDWEFPVIGGDGIPHLPEDRENFTLLLNALRAAMDALGDGVHHPLTIATTANPANIPVSYDVPAVNDVLDFVNVMSYDFNGAWTETTGHNAPLYANQASAEPVLNVDEAVTTLLKLGLDKEKLVLGLAFYGRGWSNVSPTGASDGLFAAGKGPSPGTWEDGVLDYSDIVENYVGKNGYTRYWDDDSKVPYLYNPETKVFISYDDEESICHKAGYVMRNDLGGGMVWEVTSDYKETLQALAYDVIVGGADACHFD